MAAVVPIPSQRYTRTNDLVIYIAKISFDDKGTQRPVSYDEFEDIARYLEVRREGEEFIIPNKGTMRYRNHGLTSAVVLFTEAQYVGGIIQDLERFCGEKKLTIEEKVYEKLPERIHGKD